MAKPFVKWVGGKGKLLTQLSKYLPKEVDYYYEPFVGGGAMFFYMQENYRLKSAHLNDLCRPLMLAYKCLRDRKSSFLSDLKELAEKWENGSEMSRKFLYSDKRNVLNNYISEIKPELDLRGHMPAYAAACFVYLNKTCYNGLWRVNSKGKFNVPPGVYKKPLIYDPENLTEVGVALNLSFNGEEVKLTSHDFFKKFRQSHFILEDIINRPPDKREKTFIFLDPPYKPVSRTNVPIKYAQEDADFTEQLTVLLYFMAMCTSYNIKVMLTLQDDPIVREEFSVHNYNIYELETKHTLSCENSARSNKKELCITNYKA